jgi:hypothetical protein
VLYYGDRVRFTPPLALCHSVHLVLIDSLDSCSADGNWTAEAARAGHSSLVGAAVALGELHQTVADHLNPLEDEVAPLTDAISDAATLLGRCVYRSSRLAGLLPDAPLPEPSGAPRAGATSTRELLRQAGELLERIADLLPALPLSVSLPEGYAFYALYPEMYFCSLRRALLSTATGNRFAAIGIRSIGCSLAALVAGALAEEGAQAGVETVRPRGNPFQRRIEAGPGLRARLRAWADSGATFVLADEGPGLSCSSLLSACALLEDLGVGEDRIVILAAWQGAPSRHASADLHARWARARVFHTPALEAFGGWHAILPVLEQTTRSAAGAAPAGRLELAKDLSYGRWVDHLYPSGQPHPPVGRSTERIKLLLRMSGGEEGDAEPPTLLAKFAGLGEYGQERLERAATLAAAGFSPEVLGSGYGFLLFRLAPGRPLSWSDLSARLLARMVDYYDFLMRTFSVPAAPRFDQLCEIIAINAQKGLGLDASSFIERWRPERDAIDRLPLVRLDGRPQPHEWIEVRGPGGESVILKTDSADHADDHTIVGDQSILWELAGSWEEWRMSPEVGAELLRTWEGASGDGETARLIDFYRTAYLSFRLGALYYAIEAESGGAARGALEDARDRCSQRLVGQLQAERAGATASQPG